MDVILLEKIENLGNLGDKVSVKPQALQEIILYQKQRQNMLLRKT